MFGPEFRAKTSPATQLGSWIGPLAKNWARVSY